MVISLAVVALLWAALVQRYGSSPIAAARGTGMPFAAWADVAAAKHTATHDAHVRPNVPTAAARKADDRARPRGRRL